MRPATRAIGTATSGSTIASLAARGAVAIAIVSAIVLAIVRNAGDFSATLPGGYAETLNPTLWNSPDLRSSWAFHKSTYLHGPVQYLTLYPIVFLDSYRQIAWVLLPIYSFLLWLAFRRGLAVVSLLAGREGMALPVLLSSVSFVPLLQAYVHREFEVVIVLALVWALWWIVVDRRSFAAATLAYIAWFKYIPLLFVGYLGLRRWTMALGVFLLASVAILGLAHGAFGLGNFFNNNVPDTASHVLALSEARFCSGWTPGDETLASVRQGLCRLQSQLHLSMARNAYVVLCGLVAAVYLAAHARLSFQSLDPAAERWRRALEVSIVTTIYSCFFFGHYYYLSALVIPFNVLLARYLVARDTRRWVAWGAAYGLVSFAVLPMGLIGWMREVNVWRFYMQGPTYLYGELLLVALLLWEYSALAWTWRAAALPVKVTQAS